MVAQNVPIGSSVEDHRYILDRLAIPNLRHNALEMSRRAIKAGDYIPIWALNVGEAVNVDALTRAPHPAQKASQLEFLKKHGAGDTSKYEELLQQFMADNEDPAEYDVTIGEHVTAGVFKRTFYAVINSKTIGKNALRYFGLRPLMILNSGNGKNRPKVAPDIMGHEIEHVRQALARPVIRYDKVGDLEDAGFRRELEAYAVQETLASTMMKNGYKFELGEYASYSLDPSTGAYSSTLFAINNMRREVNASRRDPMFPDSRLRKDLVAKGIKIHGKPRGDSERSISLVRGLDSIE